MVSPNLASFLLLFTLKTLSRLDCCSHIVVLLSFIWFLLLDLISLSSHLPFCVVVSFPQAKVCSSSYFWVSAACVQVRLLRRFLCRLLLGRTSSCSLVVELDLVPLVGRVMLKSVMLAGCHEPLQKCGRKGATQCPRSREWQTREPGCNGAKAAKRSYPTSEVRGRGWEELPHVWCQEWWSSGATPHPGAAAMRAQEGWEELLHVWGQEGWLHTR